MDSGILTDSVDKKTGLRAPAGKVPGENRTDLHGEFWPTEQQRDFLPRPASPNHCRLIGCQNADRREATSAKRHPVIVLPKRM